MPIGTPQGNLDIKNATLRTSNLETQNIKIGSIFVGTGVYSLEETANVGNSMSNTIQFTNTHTGFVTTSNVGIGTNTPLDTLHINGGTLFAGHIIPTTNATFDIGSAEKKVRDLYVDTNSLWVGDTTKIAFSGGKMKFKRRKVNQVPRMLVTLATSQSNELSTESEVQSDAVTFAQTIDASISTVSDLRLEHWRDYAKTFDTTKTVSDIFADNDEDYEAITASEAFMEVGSNIFTEHSLSIGKTTDPTATLDIYKEDTTAAGQTKISSITGVFSGSDATGGNINNTGLYINLDSSATGGGTSSSNPAEEHRVWGIDVDIDVTGDSDDIKGGRFLVRSALAANGSDQTSVIYGIDAQGQHNGSAPNTNVTGVNARTLKGTSSTGLTDRMIGVDAECEINAGTCTDAYGVRSQLDRNGGAVTNSYLFYGGHNGSTTTITNNYGLYVTGADKHYLEGDVGIGTDTPTYKLDVDGETILRGQGFLYHANETSASATPRYFLQFNKTLDASYPMLCNRTPSGDVVIATGTSSGGGDVERMRFNGGDGTITMNVGRGDVYFENNSNDNASGNGITLRTPTNPGSTGSIFAVRSSGNGCRLWVGQDVTGVASDSDFCAGQNGYAVGSEDDRSTYNFIVKASGNVGIGTTSPETALDVSGTVKSTHVSLGSPLNPTIGGNWVTILNSTYDGAIGDEYPNPEGGILFTNRSSGSTFPWGYYMGVVKDVASTSSTSIRFDIGKSLNLNTNGGTGGTDTLTPYLTIDDGNVGIGTTNPVGVNGGQRIEGSSSGGFEYIATRSQSTVGDGSFIGAYLFKNNDAGGTPPHYAGMSAKATGSGGKMVLYFHTAREKYETDTSDMTLDQNGRLGIGTTDPQGQLHISSGTSGDCVMILQADTDNNNEGDNPRIEFWQDGSLQESAIVQGNNELQIMNSVSSGAGIVFYTGTTTGYTNAVERMRITGGGNVGIGTTSPFSKLAIKNTTIYNSETGSNFTSSMGMIELIAANNNNARWNIVVHDNNDLYFLYTTGGTTGWGISGYLKDTVNVSQIDFTGQHRNFIDGVPYEEYGSLEGLIVSANKNKYYDIDENVTTGANAIQISQSLPLVALSNVVHDKACFGVISGVEDPETREYAQGSFVSVVQKQAGDRRAYINSVGEGAIWVTNINGSLESGDYITTSNVAGYGMKQDSDSLKNYTVAKITMDCNFDPVTQPIQIIRKEMSNVNYWVNTTYENVSEEEYSNLTEENRRTITETVYTNEDGAIFPEQNEEFTYVELEQKTYQKITSEESTTEQEGWELEVRQELVNVLNEHGQIQWEDHPTETEKAYKLRYLDADGNIVDEANAVHIAAFVGCTYHCG